MADAGHDVPLTSADTGRRAIAAGAGLTWSLLLAFATVALTLTRPLLTAALAIGMTASFAVALTFAVNGRGADALTAAFIGLVAGAIFAAYASLATWLDPKFFRPAKRWRRRW